MTKKKKWIERYCKEKVSENLKNNFSLSLNQTYHAMKAFKAEQKSLFYEITKHIVSEKNKGQSYEVKNKKKSYP